MSEQPFRCCQEDSIQIFLPDKKKIMLVVNRLISNLEQWQHLSLYSCSTEKAYFRQISQYSYKRNRKRTKLILWHQTDNAIILNCTVLWFPLLYKFIYIKGYWIQKHVRKGVHTWDPSSEHILFISSEISYIPCTLSVPSLSLLRTIFHQKKRIMKLKC